MREVVYASRLAESLLDASAGSPRWAHVKGVAGRAAELAVTVEAADSGLLVAAAWLHDIGYAPAVQDTGLHSLDGARHLEHLGYPRRLCALVAYHSGARFEADERGLGPQLAEFDEEEGPVADALAAADLTTGPSGDRVTVEERIGEILARYPPDHPVHRAVTAGRPMLVGQVQRALRRADRLAFPPPSLDDANWYQ